MIVGIDWTPRSVECALVRELLIGLSKHGVFTVEVEAGWIWVSHDTMGVSDGLGVGTRFVTRYDALSTSYRGVAKALRYVDDYVAWLDLGRALGKQS